MDHAFPSLAQVRHTPRPLLLTGLRFVERVEGEGALRLEVTGHHAEQRVELVRASRQTQRLVGGDHQREFSAQVEGAGIVGDHSQPLGVSESGPALQHQRAQ